MSVYVSSFATTIILAYIKIWITVICKSPYMLYTSAWMITIYKYGVPTKNTRLLTSCIMYRIAIR